MSEIKTETDELLLLAETLGDVKARTEKMESEFSAQAKPLDAAALALKAATDGLMALKNRALESTVEALVNRVAALEAKQ